MNGFYMVIGNKGYFLKTEAQNRTTAILAQFIDKMAEIKGLAPELVAKAKADKTTLEDLRKRINPATLEQKTLSNGYYFNISGSYFSESFPEEDFRQSVIVF